MRRSIIRFLTLIILPAILLAACGQNPAGTLPQATATRRPTATFQAAPTATPPAHLQVDPAALRGTQITFLHGWSGKRASETAALVDQFNQTNEWGIFVIVDAPGSHRLAYQKLLQLSPDVPGPALVATRSDDLRAWQTASQNLVDLNGYIQMEKIGLPLSMRADFFPALMEETQAGDFRFGLPAAGNLQILVYNQSWARELGFASAPTSFSEFRQQVCAAAQASTDGVGGWLVNTSPEAALTWLESLGTGAVFNGSAFEFNTEAVQKAFLNLGMLFNQGCAWNGRALTPYDYFAARQTLMYSGTLLDLLSQTQVNKALAFTDEWTALPYPGGESGKVLADGDAYAILKADPEQQMAAWLFIRWMSQPGIQARLAAADGSLPPGKQALNEMGKFAGENPQWTSAVRLADGALSTPASPFWREVRLILQDAMWSLFQPLPSTATPMPPADRVQLILRELDLTIADVTRHGP